VPVAAGAGARLGGDIQTEQTSKAHHKTTDGIRLFAVIICKNTI